MIDKFPDKLEYSAFKNGHEIGEQVLIKKGDILYDKLVSWLQLNESGWYNDYNTYAPRHFFSQMISILISSKG